SLVSRGSFLRRCAGLLFLGQLFLLLGSYLGAHFVLRRGLDQASRRFIMLGLIRLVAQDRTWERRAFRDGQLDGIADQQPAVLGARNRSLHEEQAARRIRAYDFEVLLRPLPIAHMA